MGFPGSQLSGLLLLLPLLLFGAAIKGSVRRTAESADSTRGTSSAVKTLQVIWDSTNGRFEFRNESNYDRTVLAIGTFEDAIATTGWAFLNISTFSLGGSYLDYHQAYAAGLLEARLTKDLIEKQWRNVYGDYCAKDRQYCKQLFAFLEENLSYMLNMTAMLASTEPFWHHVALSLVQLAGIESGLRMDKDYVYIGENLTPNVSDSMILSLHGDLQDLERKFSRVGKEWSVGSLSSCSALFALTSSNSDILAGHATWANYNTMLRIQKRFTLELHRTFDSVELVPGNGVAFSSYPGRLISGDDFYIISSGLLVTETSLDNNNSSLYSRTTPAGTVPSWIRNLVANRLASSAREWAQLYAYNNSGTYNNQWMIFDYASFTPGQRLPKGTFYVLEQLPGYVHYEDQTSVLQETGFWSSYNVPFYKDIFNESGQQQLVEKYGDFYTYDKTPRALIFKRDQKKVIDVESLRKLLRYNDFSRDPLSRCNCMPPFSAENALAARSDLNSPNGTYPFQALGYRLHGATDVKVTNASMAARLAMIIQSGPTNDQQPTFMWSALPANLSTAGHEGHPDSFNFKPLIADWSTLPSSTRLVFRYR